DTTTTSTSNVLNLNSGSFGGAADLSVTGSLSWLSGLMNGSGTTTIQSGATLMMSGALDKTIDTRTIVNSGTATWSGTGRIIGQNMAAFTNHGTLDLQANATWLNNGGVAPTLNSDGTLEKTAGAGTASIAFVLNASGGSITAAAGTAISFTGGGTLGS